MATANTPRDVGRTTLATYPTKPHESTPEEKATPVDRRDRFEKVLLYANRQAAMPLASGKRRPEPGPDGDYTEPAAGADLSRWFRPEIPAAVAGKVSTRSQLRLAPHQRAVVGREKGIPQARIQIGAGRFAGSEIQLALAGIRIEAQVLTRNEASRQTLVAAMDAVRENLRVRRLLVGTPMTGKPRDQQDPHPPRRHGESEDGRGNADR